MNSLSNIFKSNSKIIYILLLIFCLFPFVTPPVALFTGLIFALALGEAFPAFNKKASKILLQLSVVGLGFGMNLGQAVESGKDGMLFTIFSVAGTIIIGVLLAKWLKVEKKTGYLISSGTAICGGSAIAAVGPTIKANSGQMSVALGTVFILNAVALFLFPSIGHMLGLSQHQFGLWSAIAIHDTSSVVGAASAYGEEALSIATTVKLTRALWIIPLTLVTAIIFKNKTSKNIIPWFIVFFILAMLLNTFLSIPTDITGTITQFARKGLTLSLFFIGASLSKELLQKVGFKPMILGILLWIIISVSTLCYIFFIVGNN